MKVIFMHGSMNAGKSLELMKYNFNMLQGGKTPLVLCKGSRKNGKITSRIGLECDAHDMEELNSATKFDIVLVDESQFLEADEVNNIIEYAYKQNIDVVFFGLMKDFRGQLFVGTKVIIENADAIIESTSLCECCHSHKARYNIRLVNGEIVVEGESVMLDNDSSIVEYKSICAKCYRDYTYGKKELCFGN